MRRDGGGKRGRGRERERERRSARERGPAGREARARGAAAFRPRRGRCPRRLLPSFRPLPLPRSTRAGTRALIRASSSRSGSGSTTTSSVTTPASASRSCRSASSRCCSSRGIPARTSSSTSRRRCSRTRTCGASPTRTPKFRWIDAFYRDFWGLGPERSIGSYRPIPDLVWRALWGLGAREQTPFLHHWVNVLLHGMNGALVCVIAFQLTKKRGTAWLAGACFTASAVADRGGERRRRHLRRARRAPARSSRSSRSRCRLPWMAIGVFLATLFGLYSKESALCCVPLVPGHGAPLRADPPSRQAAPLGSRRARARRVAARRFVFYVEARRRMFPAPLPPELSIEANAGKPWAPRAFAAVLRWYAQPSLPKDPLNNPLVNAHGALRVAGALRVYFRGLEQLRLPVSALRRLLRAAGAHPRRRDLPGEHPRRAPDGRCRSRSRRGSACARTAAGARPSATSVVRLGDGPYRGGRMRFRSEVVDTWPVVGAACLWIVVSYFPVSNIPVLLPTVRAERFWYFPAIGSSLLLAHRVQRGARAPQARARWRAPPRSCAILLFFGFQAVCARRHANDYTDDLTFWDATRKAVPRSAKAHLNYSVMKGARGDLEERRAANAGRARARAAVADGEHLPRRHAVPLASRARGLAALRARLRARAQRREPHRARAPVPVGREDAPARHADPEGARRDEEQPSRLVGRVSSAEDILEHGEEHNGVDPKYRPRGYNEGPKD